MVALTTRVDRGVGTDIVTIAVNGNLDLATATTVRAALRKALAEGPVAIIIDLTECNVVTTAALAVFPTIAQRHMSDASLVMAVAGLSEAGDTRAPAALGPIPTYPSVHTAYAAVWADVVPDRRAGDSSQPTHIAAIDQQACLEWRLRTQPHAAETKQEDGTLLQIRATPEGGALRVSLVGEIDMSVADQLTYVLAIELPPYKHLVVDFADVTFCDSAGISAMIRLRNDLADDRTMTLINTSENVQRVFELSGLVDFLDMRN